MKYIKLFDNYQDIEAICNKYKIKNYIINKDNTVDVNGYVNICYLGLNEIPLQFGKVVDDFSCESSKLKSLKGSPYHVGSNFYCNYNELTSLEYSPEYIGNNLAINNNNIYSLDGIGKIEGYFWYYDNPVQELIDIFSENNKLYLEYLEMYNFQKKDTNIIYRTRFMEVLNDIGIKELPVLENYIYQ